MYLYGNKIIIIIKQMAQVLDLVGKPRHTTRHIACGKFLYIPLFVGATGG